MKKVVKKGTDGLKKLNFGFGFPSKSLHPYQAYESSLGTIFENIKSDTNLNSDYLMNLFSYPLNLGDYNLREDIVNLYHTEFQSDFLSPKSVMLTHGIRDSLLFLLSTFCNDQNTRTVAVEDPTYFIILSCFSQSGYNVKSFPISDIGFDIAMLSEYLDHNKISCVYTIPFFQNPTGVLMAKKSMLELIRLSQLHDFIIFSDECYNFLTYTKNSDLKPLCYYDDCKHGGSVFSLGSFSKVLSPGLRCGYIMTNKNSSLLDEFQDSKKYGWVYAAGSASGFTANIISCMIKNNKYNENVERVKQVYSKRLDCLCDVLSGTDYYSFEKPGGGYFLWVKCKKNMEEFYRKCREFNIIVNKGNNSSYQNLYDNHVRLSFGFLEIDDIIEGANRLLEIGDTINKM